MKEAQILHAMEEIMHPLSILRALIVEFSILMVLMCFFQPGIASAGGPTAFVSFICSGAM